MTRPFDIENGLTVCAEARAMDDPIMVETARLADKIADGFRADFDMTLDMETVGKALVVAAASVMDLAAGGQTPATVITNMIGLAGENLVRTARARAAEVDVDDQLAQRLDAALADPKWFEHVLTWHPVGAPDDAPGVEIPLYEHITLPDGVGELRSHTREVVEGGDEDSLGNPAAQLVVDFLGIAGVSVTAEQAAGWSREQRKQAVQWAAATHLSASDNDDVEVPLRPAFLSEVSGG
ncbi:hypothetical protein [Actinophytocola sp.]|uniref:hypothetical protein n=1 Tax=Actinophytocola sp. TaxID=1872138 RepID=UPI002D3B1763|nr:hypothetical protein [Actinophytocola sp.]HYQ69651.1 hypothetical protein [Actinophytocola sp.]